MADESYDVILVGYGPVGQALALMLGRQGRKVAVCERWKTRYELPRAVCIDHEIYRVLSANGMGSLLPEISHKAPRYQWFNADWEELLVIDWAAESISGGTEVNFVHQPTLERSLDEQVNKQPSVDTFLGWEVIAVEQNSTLCNITMRSQSGALRGLSADYVVGCDGANSLVRRAIGGPQEDRGFEADWLVIDVLLKDGTTIEELGIPPAGQYCNPVRPTTIVPAGVREGKLFRRWEFMRLPGENIEEMEREPRVWELLEPWAGPDDIELVRHKVYNFRSLMASKWRDGRLLLAGDAAHVMPPFMGQGMCSGMRDAWNLAWKLGLILDGKADDRILDSYQAERMPHVSQLIDLSIYLGKIICIPDPIEAARRDRAFQNGEAAPPPPFPHLVSGLLHRTDAGTVCEGAGSLSPHVLVEHAGVSRRLDEVLGIGFSLVTRGYDASQELDDDTLAALRLVEMRFASIRSPENESGLIDLDGRLEPFMSAHGWVAMIIRPDFYVYGGTSQVVELNALVKDFLADLQQAGVRIPVAGTPSAGPRRIA
jgi:2-polyprenyl-6-methoxyphenol hydroxylase-like FAD-dependent oxidoreductase